MPGAFWGPGRFEQDGAGRADEFVLLHSHLC